ncbi:hypothetical protein BKA67DRAFT_537231 [Truncatella angustata]|uniref:Zinc finger PHD-type domain-containing protein n=1 Tax=Truncatella angustata TaxID=152316 RepID=A0A9P8UK06_9PEZI|nr:uncharacterized protein BKA67DRAFT_537231 [Truncatella angustata]KAH6653591.1 hypothetical protein BKA67DRAFT_537231 [Truncatella angustata]
MYCTVDNENAFLIRGKNLFLMRAVFRSRIRILRDHAGTLAASAAQHENVTFWGAEDNIVPPERARFGLPGDRENVVKLNADQSSEVRFSESRMSNRRHCYILPRNLKFTGRSDVLKRPQKKLFIQQDCQKLTVLDLDGVGNRRPRGSWYDGHLEPEESGKWFLVVDNVDDVEIRYGSFDPESVTGYVALEVAGLDVVDLKEMGSEEAVSLLEKSLSRQQLLGDKQIVAELLEELAHLPLAIAQAVAYLNRNRQAFMSSYRKLLRGSEKDMVGLLSREFRDGSPFQASQRSVATTWLVSFDQISVSDKDATRLLSFISCIEFKAILRSLLPRMETAEVMEHAIGTLCGNAFLLNRVFPSSDKANRERWRTYLPHAVRALHESGEHRIQERHDLFYRVGQCFFKDRRFKEAVKALEETSGLRRDQMSDTASARLTSEYELTRAYLDDRRIKDMIVIYERAVAVREQTLDERDHDRLGVTTRTLTAELNGVPASQKKLPTEDLRVFRPAGYCVLAQKCPARSFIRRRSQPIMVRDGLRQSDRVHKPLTKTGKTKTCAKSLPNRRVEDLEANNIQVNTSTPQPIRQTTTRPATNSGTGDARNDGQVLQEAVNSIAHSLKDELRKVQLEKERLKEGLLKTKNQLVAELIRTKEQISKELQVTFQQIHQSQNNPPRLQEVSQPLEEFGEPQTNERERLQQTSNDQPEEGQIDECVEPSLPSQAISKPHDNQDIAHIHNQMERTKTRRSGPSLKRKTIGLGETGKVFSAVVFYNPTHCEMEAAMYLPPGQPMPDLNQLFRDLAGGRISASQQPRTIQTECLSGRPMKRSKISGRAVPRIHLEQPLNDNPENEQQGKQFSSADSFVNEKNSVDETPMPRNLEIGPVALYPNESASPNHQQFRDVICQAGANLTAGSLEPSSPKRYNYDTAAEITLARAANRARPKPAPAKHIASCLGPATQRIPDIDQPIYDRISKAVLKPFAVVDEPLVNDSWQLQKHRDIIRDYTDVHPDEKEYIYVWDAFAQAHKANNAPYFDDIYLEFIEEKASWLVALQTRTNEAMKHLLYLNARDALNKSTVSNALSILRNARSQARPALVEAESACAGSDTYFSKSGCAICGQPFAGPRQVICANLDCDDPFYHDDCVRNKAKMPVDSRDWRCNGCCEVPAS